MNKNKLVLILFCISLPLFLLLFSYKVSLFFTDLTVEQQNALDFLNNKGKLQGYTEAEVSHMNDVKEVTRFADYVFYLLLLTLSLILTHYKKNKQFTIKLLKYGGITTVSVILLTLFFSLLSFNSSFTIFHNIFFPQGNWTFPSDSLLIQTFPLEFFIEISRNIFLLALVLGSIFIVLSYYIKHVRRSKRN